MAEQRSQNSLLTVFGVLFTVIALVALVALVQLKSKADTAPEDVDIGNTAPVVEATFVSDVSGSGDISGTGFTPNEGIVKTIYVRGTVSDGNGCTDLASVSVKLSRSGATGGPACTPDNNDCYATSTTDFVGCTGSGDNDADFEVGFDITNYVDPTDSGAYSAEDWLGRTIVTDAGSLTDTLDLDFEVNSVAALDISPTAIAYGSVGLGATSLEQTLTFTTVGNRDIDSTVKANNDMTSSLPGYNDIPSGNVHFSTTTGFTYTDLDVAVPVQNTPAEDTLGFTTLLQQTDDLGAAPTQDAYFLLKVPASGVNGTYSNILTFTATAL